MILFKKLSLLTIALAIAILLLASIMPAICSDVVSGSAGTSGAPEKIDLLYFHRTDRCVSCNNAEQYARETLDSYFPSEVKSGLITIQSIDYQKNAEMAQKYNVNMQGLKLKITKNRQEMVKDVPELWAYVRDKSAYMSYLRDVLSKELGR